MDADLQRLVSVHKRYLDADQADFYYNVLAALLPWTTFAPSPRSRLVHQWDPSSDSAIDNLIVGLVQPLEHRFGVRVQGVFLNYYRNGEDYCPYHRDTYGCDVWTLSLGGTRDFLVKPDRTGTKSTKWTLESGDLYLMKRQLHQTYRHSIPARKGMNQGRISVVFFTN